MDTSGKIMRGTIAIVTGVALLAWVGIDAFSPKAIYISEQVIWSTGAALLTLGLCWHFRGRL